MKIICIEFVLMIFLLNLFFIFKVNFDFLVLVVLRMNIIGICKGVLMEVVILNFNI